MMMRLITRLIKNKGLMMGVLWIGFIGLLGAQSPMGQEAARKKYTECYTLYESDKFLDCFNCCEALMSQMGQKTGRVLSLTVRSGIQSLPLGLIRDKEVSVDQVMKLNYDNLSKVRAYVQELADRLNPNDTSQMNNRVANEYLAILDMRIKDQAKQKDRTPEKAIQFLNDCAEKFKKYELLYENNKIDYTFKLIRDTLFIESKGRSWNDKAKFRSAHVAQMKIPLKEVWIERRSVRYWPDRVNSPYELAPPSSLFTTVETDSSGPVIVSTITINGSKVLHDKLLMRGTTDYNKDMQYPYEKLDRFYRTFEPAEHPVYLYYFFNSSSKEYEEGNYRKRIEEAFSYLIEHFGGGTPMKKQR